MRRYIATIAASAAMLTGLGLTSAGSASAATSVGWCNAVKNVTISSYGNYIKQPYHSGTGSRNCTLALGSSGSAVSALQTALKECNFADSLRVDGDFGSLTRNALIYAQDRRGTEPDGVYGPDTRVALSWPSYYNGTMTGGCAPGR